MERSAYDTVKVPLLSKDFGEEERILGYVRSVDAVVTGRENE